MNPPPKYLFLTIAALLTVSLSVAQPKIITGVIKDVHSEETLPFSSVKFKNTMVGNMADSAGNFVLRVSSWPSDTLEISAVGYKLNRIPLKKSGDSIKIVVLMERGAYNDGVTIKTKVNKGLYVWKKIVEHKPQNDRYRFNNFSYELYNKLELDLKNINFEKLGKFKPLRPVSKLINGNIDTAEGLRYLPAFLTEALSDYYYQKNPLKRREVIKAVNTNGVKNESVTKLLGGMDQVVNVYSNFIPIFDKAFVSPASDNGDYYYQYNVTDTQVINNKRYFHLVFVPRRKGGDTFEGDCWVQAGSFAIQKMSLRLGKDANVNFVDNLSLIQEYSLLGDSIWFLSKDKFVVDISPAGKNKPGFIGRKTTTYRNIVINDSSVISELSKNKKLEEIIVQPAAADKPADFWASARHEELSRTEKGIIKMIDTLTNTPVFKRFTKTMAFIGTGYTDVGNVQLGPWYNWITSNSWEGFRLRFDYASNKYFNKKIRLHTYLAYGFGDKQLKGQAEVFYLPSKSPRTYLYAGYTSDLDFGQNYYSEVSSDNIFALAIRKQDVPVKFIKVDETKFEFFKETTSWMSNRLTVAHRNFSPLRNLLPADSFSAKLGSKPLSSFEVSLRLRFAYLERFVENHFYRTSLGSPYPIGEITVTKGFKNILGSNNKYTKLFTSVSDNMKIPPLGTVSWNVYAGKTFGQLPYTMLDIAPGNELYYYNSYAFNLMNRWEYLHDQYAGIKVEHIIGNGIFRLFPKLKFRQLWTAKGLVGKLSDQNKALNLKQGHSFQTLDGKPYLELGTGIDNIFRLLRVDFVWRVLSPNNKRENDKKFGVFGSFRVSF